MQPMRIFLIVMALNAGLANLFFWLVKPQHRETRIIWLADEHSPNPLISPLFLKQAEPSRSRLMGFVQGDKVYIHGKAVTGLHELIIDDVGIGHRFMGENRWRASVAVEKDASLADVLALLDRFQAICDVSVTVHAVQRAPLVPVTADNPSSGYLAFDPRRLMGSHLSGHVRQRPCRKVGVVIPRPA